MLNTRESATAKIIKTKQNVENKAKQRYKKVTISNKYRISSSSKISSKVNTFRFVIRFLVIFWNNLNEKKIKFVNF